MPTPKKFFGEERLLMDTWRKIISRCRDPQSKDYANYGGRGITVCVEWVDGANGRTGLSLFYEHVGPKPSRRHSIDRINNDMGYQPGNVRWATSSEQLNNTRVNRLVTYRGETVTITQAARKAGNLVRASHAITRIDRGWPVEAAVETPPLYRTDPKTGRIVEGRKITRPQINGAKQ